MQIYGIIYIAVLFLLTSLLAIGGYFIQRERYWIRIWKELGKPDVKSIKELKTYIQNQPNPVPYVKVKNSNLGINNK